MTASIARWFPTTDLAHIGDEISDGLFAPGEDFPLAQFDGLRTDFSLARLRHYTGTPGRGRAVLCPVHQLSPLRR